jgi:KDO2-lipid IV(A) lauroyltransferase
MNLILASILIFFIMILGLIPFPLLYFYSDLLYWVLYRVFGYRKKVVLANLTGAFPEMERKYLKRIIKKTYKNFTDILLEGIKGFTMSHDQVFRRHRVLNPEILDPFRASGKSIITVPSHYGNWEWGALSAGLYLEDYSIVAFYKPLTNPYADRFMRKNRSRTGTFLASIYKTSSTFKDYSNKRTLFIMAADQSPSNARNAVWVDFLGRKTAFLHGPEKHALHDNLPVFFVDIQREKRGFYTLELSLIAENPAELMPGELTRRYAGKLEEVIRKKPEDWLWTHRRWKLT